MKQKLIAIAALFTGALGFAQYEGYNTWSIEAKAGLTSFNGLTGKGDIYAGYGTGGIDILPTTTKGFRFAPLHVDLGVRKMLSPKFGFKLSLSYTNIKNTENTFEKFNSTYIGGDLQGVINLNQMLDFKLFKNRVNFLVHGGLGYSFFTVDEKYIIDNYAKDQADHVMSGIIGFTTQVRITDKVSVFFDATNTLYGKHQTQLDGSRIPSDRGLVDASVMNLTGGLIYYFGKNEKHLDWYESPKSTDKEAEEAKDYAPAIEELQNKIKALEARPVAAAGDVNSLQNRIKDLENQIKNLNTSTKDMMDANIIHAYFDFDQDEPKPSSQRDIQTAIDYMKNNANAKMELVGYADKIGTAAYNENLSKRRVENIKNKMVKAGIAESRLSLSWRGSKDTPQNSADERALARKVVFRVQ